MTPTPEQIEAALKAYNASTKSSFPENAMRAALTAAAEVGDRRSIKDGHAYFRAEDDPMQGGWQSSMNTEWPVLAILIMIMGIAALVGMAYLL